MQIVKILISLGFLLCLTLPTICVGQPASWPGDGVFTAANCVTTASNDKVADAPGGKADRDIVGDAKFPAFYTYDDGTYAFFRIRLDSNPAAGGGKAPLNAFGWGVGIDTNNDSKTIEYAWVVNGIDETVKLTRNDKTPLKTWKPTLDKNKKGPNGQTYKPIHVEVRKAVDGSNFGGNQDYFITVALNMAEAESVTKNDPSPLKWGGVRLWVATSSNGFSLDKDFMCWDDSTGTVDLSKSLSAPIAIGLKVAVTSVGSGTTLTPTLTGTGKAGQKVTLSLNGKVTTVTPNGQGVWTFKVPSSWGLKDGGSYTAKASVTDNGATASDDKTLVVQLPINYTFGVGALIIPMDGTYQTKGLLKAFGLLYALLKANVPVRWVIKAGKGYGDIDFSTSGNDVLSNAKIATHGYAGGPFVIDSADAAAALVVIKAWQKTSPETTVHTSDKGFTANIARVLTSAPTIALFADGKQAIARKYMQAAGIPDSTGSTAWPDSSPDMLDPNEVAGSSTSDHRDGALFDAGGTAKYCQFMSMHWDVKEALAKPEVVAEVREFLKSPTHFFAECQAVNAFENTAPHGFFLTPNGLKIGNQPSAVDHHLNDLTFAQLTGTFKTVGGSEPAYTLPAGDKYKASGGSIIRGKGKAEGEQDVWITGYLDGKCPVKANTCPVGKDFYGRVTYLGGHQYSVDLPVSSNPDTQGARLFLQALFDAPCAAKASSPGLTLTLTAPAATAVNQLTYTLTYTTSGPGTAGQVTLTNKLPANTTFVSATGGGKNAGGVVSWSIGNLPAGAKGSVTVTVQLASPGTYTNAANVGYSVGATAKTDVSNTVKTAFLRVKITSPTNAVLNTTTPQLKGTGTANAKVSISIGAQSAEVTTDKDGKWSFTVPMSWGLKDGASYTAKASLTQAGVTVTDTHAFKLELDPTVKLVAPASGTSGVVTSTTPTIQGTANPGATVTVEIGANKTTVIADKDGKWNLKVPSGWGLENGKTYDVKASSTKGAKTATDGAKISVQLAPMVALTTPKSATTSAVDTVTPTIEGTANPGATVIVEIGANKTTVTAGKDGKWSLKVPVVWGLEDGKTYDVKASATQYGKTAKDAAKVSVQVPPMVALTTPKSATTSAVDTVTPTLEGTAKPGATVIVEIGANKTTVTAGKDGKWSLKVPVVWGLEDGKTYDVKASATQYGKTAKDAAKVSVQVPPMVALTTPKSATTSAVDTVTPTLEGTAKPGATVIVEIGANKTTVTAGKDGKWSLKVPVVWGLEDGKTYDVKASATQYGKTAKDAAKVSVNTPQFLTFKKLADPEPTPTPTLEGTTKPNTVVTIVIGAKTTTVKADSKGAWSFKVPASWGLKAGDKTTAKVSVLDGAGTLKKEQPLNIALDLTVALSEPNNKVNTTTPKISGKSTPGAKVTVEVNGKTLTTTADQSGEWSVSVPAKWELKDGGSYVVNVTATKDGKTAKTKGKLDVELPATVALTNPKSGAPLVTQSVTPTITGTANASATVSIEINGKTETVKADSAGNWSFQVPASWQLKSGQTYDVDVSSSAGGKTAKDSGKVTIEEPLGVTLSTSATPTATTTPPLTGTSKAGAKISVTVNGKTFTTTTDKDGKWSLKIPASAGLVSGKTYDVDVIASKDGKSAKTSGKLVVGGAPSCTDGKKNSDETDVDCGGSCPDKCKLTEGCAKSVDCTSNKCDVALALPVCVTLNECVDAQLSGDESDVDCGGSCPAKCDDGKKCKSGTDCKSGLCDDKATPAVCVAPPSCTDKLLNGDETDVDCGGSCPDKCATGQSCKVNGDCKAQLCDTASKTPVCLTPTTCSDGTKNGDETDIDCGGGCPNKCVDGKGCAAGGDCVSGKCDQGVKPSVCVPGESCGDKALNGDETDVDCGGSCETKCDEGKGCKQGSDCKSDSCDTAASPSICIKPTSCTDGKKNGDETDVDCGGGCPEKCKVGKGCGDDDDCDASICDTSKTPAICATPPSCTDGELNGDETDVDCGGACPEKCVDDDTCVKDDDCKSKICDTTSTPSVCKPATTCTDGKKNGDETDVDCGGACPNKCDDGEGCTQPGDCVSDACNVDKTCHTPKPCKDPNAVDPDDCDGDGLKNDEEDRNNNGVVDEGETDPNNPDTDGDGLQDGKEVQDGTDPLTPLLSLSGGGCSTSDRGEHERLFWPFILALLALLLRRRARPVGGAQ